MLNITLSDRLFMNISLYVGNLSVYGLNINIYGRRPLGEGLR